MINLQNKKVILTGGSRGIGLSILKELNNLNAKILTIGTNETRLANIKTVFKHYSKKFDISKHDDIENNFKEFCAELGGLDVLINNAGITKDNLALRMSFQDWNEVLNINLNSTFLFTQNAIKVMLKIKVAV